MSMCPSLPRPSGRHSRHSASYQDSGYHSDMPWVKERVNQQVLKMKMKGGWLQPRGHLSRALSLAQRRCGDARCRSPP
ncbi:hypothetical protein EYF80_019337 [Liparis tanakae]|uniref:Uncharacterized protein n=1 Tax=Liparis tanakae TaxID=230148 RepID=A0A4Z2HY49_9TELE|nr:hypothetical protein EYF80_019337 [Liparis tanakae]